MPEARSTKWGKARFTAPWRNSATKEARLSWTASLAFWSCFSTQVLEMSRSELCRKVSSKRSIRARRSPEEPETYWWNSPASPRMFAKAMAYWSRSTRLSALRSKGYTSKAARSTSNATGSSVANSGNDMANLA